jgi:CHAT domain-containing protein/tetratricopeptide (TPR) repeat protein
VSESPQHGNRVLDGQGAPSADEVANLAELVVQQCRTDPALALNTARAAVEMARARDDHSYAQALRALANACQANDRHAEAIEHYQNATELYFQAGLDTEAARTISSQLAPLALLGRYEESLQRSEQARAIFERHGETARAARLEINRGNIFHRLDRFQEALACYDRALSAPGIRADAEASAAIYSNRAITLTSLNRFPDALASYHRAREVCESHGMSLLVAQADYNIAYLYFLYGYYGRALALLDQVRASFRRLGNRYHLALCDLDQAEIFLELNCYKEAQRLAEAAQAQFEALGMRYETARSVVSRAAARELSGDHDGALELFATARELFVREQNRVWVQIVDLHRALVYLNTGAAEAARDLAGAVHANLAAAGIRTKAVYARLLVARACLLAGDAESAEAHCAAALRDVEQLQAPWLSFHCHNQLGGIHRLRGDKEAARQSYRQAIATLELMRSHIDFDELKIAFVKDKLEAIENFVLLSLEGEAEAAAAGAGSPAAQTGVEERQEMQREVFRAIEQAKSRSVADLLAHPAAPADAESAGTIEQRIRALREELNWHYRKMALEELQPGGQQLDPAGLIRAIREREKELLALLRQLPPQGRGGGFQPVPPVSPEDIQAILPGHVQLLEYYIAGKTVIAVLLDGSGVRFFSRLADISRVEEDLHLLRFQMARAAVGRERFDPFSPQVQAEVLGHLRDLYRALLEPLAPHLTAGHLVIVPHGLLHYLPFHALYDGGRHACERWAISYASSAALLCACALRAPQAGGHSLILQVGSGAAPEIPGEASRVRALLPDAHLFAGPEATAERLRALGETARFVHIASHAMFRRDNPLFSSIQLGGGWMTLLDVYSLRLNCELMTLSGCATGMGLVLAGDEFVGLARGFLHAGAAALLASLWDVNDEATACLMDHFYSAVRDGVGKAESLRRAMAAVRARYPHPFFWAPFVLVGAGW